MLCYLLFRKDEEAMLENMKLDGDKDQATTKREKIRLKSADPRLERRQNGSSSSEPPQRQISSATAFNIPVNSTPSPQIREKRCVFFFKYYLRFFF